MKLNDLKTLPLCNYGIAKEAHGNEERTMLEIYRHSI